MGFEGRKLWGLEQLDVLPADPKAGCIDGADVVIATTTRALSCECGECGAAAPVQRRDSGRRSELLQAALEGLPEETRARALLHAADVRDADAVASLFDACLQRFGRLDFLFNNAGVGAPAVALEALSLEHWRAALDTNLTGAFLCTQHAFRIMKAQTPRGGRILNNGSISAHVPRPNSAAYTASKHGITGLTRAAALDGRAFEIAVGQIDIGNAATPLTERMEQGVLQADGSVRTEARIDVTLVADTVVQIAQLPLSANVPFMTIMATQMPFAGRG